jgi:hypothetical protein
MSRLVSLPFLALSAVLLCVGCSRSNSETSLSDADSETEASPVDEPDNAELMPKARPGDKKRWKEN